MKSVTQIIAIESGRVLVFALAVLALLCVVLVDAPTERCADDCEEDCQETCDCIDCLHHQLLVADLLLRFESSHDDQARMPFVEHSLSEQVSARGIDHPPQNLS